MPFPFRVTPHTRRPGLACRTDTGPRRNSSERLSGAPSLSADYVVGISRASPAHPAILRLRCWHLSRLDVVFTTPPALARRTPCLRMAGCAGLEGGVAYYRSNHHSPSPYGQTSPIQSAWRVSALAAESPRLIHAETTLSRRFQKALPSWPEAYAHCRSRAPHPMRRMAALHPGRNAAMGLLEEGGYKGGRPPFGLIKRGSPTLKKKTLPINAGARFMRP